MINYFKKGEYDIYKLNISYNNGNMDFIIRKCQSCGAVVKVIEECECACGLECCGEKMEIVKANSVDASAEKHIPNYEIVNDKIIVTVNHVMEEDHYIEWIMVDYGDSYFIKEFKPGDEPKVIVDYKTGMKAYSYCNKHSLWVNEKIL